MATAARAAVPAADATTFRTVPLTALSPSSLNPRKVFDGLEELAASMRDGVGVIEPLVVRAKGKGFEIVAGERRWRAAKLAELETVPVVVKALDDKQVLELMVIENNQRANVSPLEEAAGFKGLMRFGVDLDQVAGRIGRSRKYIYDRVKLLDLVEPAQELLRSGRITAGHAILLARLDPKVQQQAIGVARRYGYGRVEGPLFEYEQDLLTDEEEAEQRKAKDPYRGLKTRSVRELQAWIDEHVRFDATAAVNRELFPETAGQVDDAAEAGRKAVLITRAYHVHPDAKVDGQRIYSRVSWKRAPKACDYTATGVVVAGAGRGEAFPVCVRKDKCTRHWGAEIKRKAREQATRSKAGPAKASGAPARDSWQEQQRRDREARDRKDKVLRESRDQIAGAVVAKMRPMAPKQLLDVIASEELYGGVSVAPKALGVELTDTLTAADALLVLAVETIIGDLYEQWTSYDQVGRLLKRVGLKLDTIAPVPPAPRVQTSPTQAKKPAKAAAKASRKK